MAKYKIIDNFLDQENFLNIKQAIVTSGNFPWYITENISGTIGDTDYYFTHLIYKDHSINSSYYNIIKPIVDKLNVFALRRIKANFYPSTKEIIKHAYHIDHPTPNTGSIYYINTNNGKTILDDGTEVESIENRLLIFEANVKHRSTTCTDDPIGRFNINFNYFPTKENKQYKGFAQ
jgi:hypothetical protein